MGGGQVGLAGRRDEADLGGVHRQDVAAAEQLGVADQQHLAGAGQLLQALHRPDHLSDLPGATVKGSMPHRHATIAADRDPGLDLLEIGPAVLGLAPLGRGKASLDLLVDPVQRHRGHIPVQPGHINPEHRDRPRPHRPDHLVQLRCHGVQRPPDPVVVERVGGDTKDLLDRPLTCPVGHPQQRPGAGQPVGDQRLDHLPVGHPRDLPNRTRTVHDPGKVQPPAELAHHRQGPQQLLDTGRRVGVADRTQAGRRAAHPQTLPHPPINPNFNPRPPLPPAMCGRQG
jgi:hypothetical protein